MRIGIPSFVVVLWLSAIVVVDASSKSNNNRGTSTALRRIKKEYKDAVDMGIAYDWVKQKHIQRKPKEGTKRKPYKNHNILCLGPITTNLRQWHFSFRGAGESLYGQGLYHGQILLPKDYPMSPPSIQMWTPSGRFVPFTDICLSASNYHPESWTPRWSIHAIVNALRLHMLNAPSEIGGMHSDHDETLEHARKSLQWKKTWVQTGKTRTKITVDHKLLIATGVIRIFDEEKEEIDNGDLVAEENPKAHSDLQAP